MKRLILGLMIFNGYAAFAQSIYFPPNTAGTWESVSIGSLNYCQENIDSLYAFLEREESKSFILLKDGKIVLEKYFGNYGQDSTWVWFSAGKSLTSVLTGLAQQQGFLDINDRTSDYLGKWTTLPPEKEDQIKIKHQLSMTTGLDEYDFTCTDSACLKYKADAGTRWYYHNAPYTLLRDVIENATGKNYNVFTQQSLKSEIGMGGIWIPLGYYNFYWSNARSMARFGLFMMAKGSWDGTQVMTDTNYFNAMITRSQNLNPSYGYLWWLNRADSIILPSTDTILPSQMASDAPRDMYSASGSQGQYISVSPSKGMVIVRQGLKAGHPQASINLLNDMWKHVLALECEPVSAIDIKNTKACIVPNPAYQELHVQVPANNILHKVLIINNLGQIISSSPGESIIDVSGLTPGQYFVHLEMEHSITRHKLVILR